MDVLVVGDSKMGDVPTRDHMATSGSRFLCAYRPIHATAALLLLYLIYATS